MAANFLPASSYGRSLREAREPEQPLPAWPLIIHHSQALLGHRLDRGRRPRERAATPPSPVRL